MTRFVKIAALVFAFSASTSAFADFAIKFKAYNTPQEEVDPNCDLHVAVDFGSEGNVSLDLSNKLEGTCELPMPREDKRSYTMKALGRDSCGSTSWESTEAYVDGVEVSNRKITIVDNRKRTCESVGGTWMSKFNIVEVVGGEETSLFSDDKSITGFGG